MPSSRNQATSPQAPYTHQQVPGHDTQCSSATGGHSRSVWGPPPPYHSKCQPHRPRVVDDVSSHLGFQEGALSQASVLIRWDLLGHPRERDLSATEHPSPPPSCWQACHFQVMWSTVIVMGKGNRLHAGQDEELKAPTATTGLSFPRREGQASRGRWDSSRSRRTSCRGIATAQGSVPHSRPRTD